MAEERESLRDSIERAFDATVDGGQSQVAAVEEAPVEEKAERPRDEHGRFVATEEKPQEPVEIKPEAPVERKRPSTWKKDYWEAYDKLATDNPQLADYILQREAEYTKGVSTYKSEWDRARPLLEAIAPYEPILQQYNLDPAKHAANLFAAHQALALGSPQEKLSMFAKLAADYQVPLGELLYQGQDGQWYLQQPQQQTPTFKLEDIDSRVQSVLAQHQIETEIESFAKVHPHFEAVRETMSRLLDAGIANGLEDAYNRSLKMPEHEHLVPPTVVNQEEQRRKAAEAARRKAISPRSATPVTPPASGTDLRGTIEAAFDEHASRV